MECRHATLVSSERAPRLLPVADLPNGHIWEGRGRAEREGGREGEADSGDRGGRRVHHKDLHLPIFSLASRPPSPRALLPLIQRFSRFRSQSNLVLCDQEHKLREFRRGHFNDR